MRQGKKHRLKKWLLICGLCCFLLFCVYYQACLSIRSGDLHLYPVINIEAIDPYAAQTHVTFFDDNYYYYKENGKNGIYRLSNQGEELIYPCSGVMNINADADGIFFLETSHAYKTNPSVLHRLSYDGVDQAMGNQWLLSYDHMLLEDRRIFCYYFSETTTEVDGRYFDRTTLEEIADGTLDLYPNYFPICYDSDGQTEAYFRVYRSDKDQAVDIPAPANLYCPVTMSRKQPDKTGRYYALCMVDPQLFNVFVPPLNKHKGDIFYALDPKTKTAEPITKTNEGERMIYADEEVYCVLQWKGKTYSFYDITTGKLIGQQPVKGIRWFGTYDYELQGQKIFVYAKNRLVDVLDIPES